MGPRHGHRTGAPAHDRRREGFRLRDQQCRLDDERGAVAVVVAGRGEDRVPAAGRAQGRRHVSRPDPGEWRTPGAPCLEVSAPRRSGRRHDPSRRHRRGLREDDAPEDGSRLSPRHVGRQHRHGRVHLEP